MGVFFVNEIWSVSALGVHKFRVLSDFPLVNSERFAHGARIRVDQSVLASQQLGGLTANWLTLASLLATSRHHFIRPSRAA